MTSDTGAQTRLFRKVMQSARVSPDDISYGEMHGTGTQTGDPAEMNAVASISKDRHAENPLTVGGFKAASNTNLDSVFVSSNSLNYRLLEWPLC